MAEDDMEQKVKDQEEEIKNLKERIKTLKEEYEELQSTEEGLKKNLEMLKGEALELDDEIEELEKEKAAEQGMDGGQQDQTDGTPVNFTPAWYERAKWPKKFTPKYHEPAPRDQPGLTPTKPSSKFADRRDGPTEPPRDVRPSQPSPEGRTRGRSLFKNLSFRSPDRPSEELPLSVELSPVQATQSPSESRMTCSFDLVISSPPWAQDDDDDDSRSRGSEESEHYDPEWGCRVY